MVWALPAIENTSQSFDVYFVLSLSAYHVPLVFDLYFSLRNATLFRGPDNIDSHVSIHFVDFQLAMQCCLGRFSLPSRSDQRQMEPSRLSKDPTSLRREQSDPS